MNIFTELHDLHATGRNIGIAAQNVEQADAGMTREALVDHLKGRHPAPNDPVLAGKIVALDALVIGFVIGIDITVVYAVEQRINFVL